MTLRGAIRQINSMDNIIIFNNMGWHRMASFFPPILKPIDHSRRFKNAVESIAPKRGLNFLHSSGRPWESNSALTSQEMGKNP